MSEGAGAAGVAAASGEGQAAQATEGAAQAASTESSQEAGKASGEQAAEQKTETGEAEKKTEEGEKKPPHKYHDRLTEAYPDRKFESDQDYDTAFDEHLTDLTDYRKRGIDSNAKLNDFFDANPKASKAIIDSMSNGIPFNVALARHFGPEDFTLNEGDDQYADFDKNVKAREADLAQRRETDETFKKNMAESDKAVAEFAKEDGLDTEQAQAILNEFNDMMAEMFTGKVTKATLQKIKRAVEFEEAVKDAAESGELKGKNKKIVAEMASEEKPKGDGLPAPAKGGEVKDGEKPTPQKIDKIIDGFNNKDVYSDN